MFGATLDGWAAIHERPLRAMLTCLAAGVLGLITHSYIFFQASETIGWRILAPGLVYFVSHLTTLLLLLAYGPSVSKKSAIICLCILTISANVFCSLEVLAWPGEFVPPVNYLVYVFLFAVALLGINIACSLGLWFMDHPRDPYR